MVSAERALEFETELQKVAEQSSYQLLSLYFLL